MKPTQQYLTSAEAAAYVGCKPVTIRQNVSRGKLKPALTVGKVHLFTPQSIRSFKRHYVGKK